MNRFNRLSRREFLKVVAAGGAVAMIPPLLKLSLFSSSFSYSHVRSSSHFSESSRKKLLEIALKYGAEFGEKDVRVIKEDGHGSI